MPQKKQGQKYQNSFAFKHNRNSKLTKKILSTQINGLCQRCYDIVDWRKRFRKYKPLSTPKKCVQCQGKSITEAYHVYCRHCAKQKNVCAKCLQPKDIIIEKSVEEKQAEIEKEREAILEGLSERQKRTALRLLERGLEDASLEDDEDLEMVNDD